MTAKFILWAQALDNASPDHFHVQGEELSANDSVRRQEAVSSVSSVIKKGTRVYEVSGVLLTADGRNFVLEVRSAQLDRSGRTAPIVCYGDYDTVSCDALGDAVTAALDDFTKRIGRTLRPDDYRAARDAFEILKKKSSTTKLVRAFAIGASVFALLALYWLARRGP